MTRNLEAVLPHIEPFEADFTKGIRWTMLRVITTNDRIVMDPYYIGNESGKMGVANSNELLETIKANGKIELSLPHYRAPLNTIDLVHIQPIEASLRRISHISLNPRPAPAQGAISGIVVVHAKPAIYLIKPAYIRNADLNRIGVGQYQHLHSTLERGLLEAGTLRLNSDEIQSWHVDEHLVLGPNHIYLNAYKPNQ